MGSYERTSRTLAHVARLYWDLKSFASLEIERLMSRIRQLEDEARESKAAVARLLEERRRERRELARVKAELRRLRDLVDKGELDSDWSLAGQVGTDRE